ncbi:Transcription initiation factor TFIID subunit 13 [Acarospora aff. strigata]|nr:Transcription initiation factor TFIID subunit 13 [Acarospora aff. strigata]
MAEPRARAARHKGQLNFPSEIKSLLHAFGDVPNPLPETIKTLDEIVTDFIIETCHSAALHASYARRQKIKVDDFKFAIRRDERMLGRVLELLALDRELREARRQFDEKDDRVVIVGVGLGGEGVKGDVKGDVTGSGDGQSGKMDGA